MKKKLLLFTLTIFLLTGCWGKQELNELAITIALGVDKLDDKYTISAQVVDPTQLVGQKGAESSRTSVATFHATGETVFESIRKITAESPRRIYPSHLRLLIIGEEVAKEGINEILDIFSRDYELRSDYYILVTKNTSAKDVLSVTTPIERIPAANLFISMKLAEKVWGHSNTITLDKLIKDLSTNGKELAIPVVSLVGNKEMAPSLKNVEHIEPLARIIVDNLSVFQNDQLIGWLDNTDTRSVNFITNNIKSTILNVPCHDGKIALEIKRAKSKITSDIKNENLVGKVDLRLQANIGEVACKVNLNTPATINRLEKYAEKELKKQLQQTIHTLQNKYQVDIFGFGTAVHRQHPKVWRKYKKNWNKYFSAMDVDLHINVEIKHTGTTNNSFF